MRFTCNGVQKNLNIYHEIKGSQQRNLFIINFYFWNICTVIWTDRIISVYIHALLHLVLFIFFLFHVARDKSVVVPLKRQGKREHLKIIIYITLKRIFLEERWTGLILPLREFFWNEIHL